MSLNVFLEKVNIKVEDLSELNDIKAYRRYKEIPNLKEAATSDEIKWFEELKEKYDSRNVEIEIIEKWRKRFALEEKVKEFAKQKDDSEKEINESSYTSIIIRKEDIDDLVEILNRSNSGIISILKDLKEDFDFKNNTLFYYSYF